jgi:hypothetical protein
MWALTLSEMKECGWLNPEPVAQIELTIGQPDALRHASFAGLREDKEARLYGNSLAQGLDRPGTEQPSTHGDHQRRVPAPKPRTNVERAVLCDRARLLNTWQASDHAGNLARIRGRKASVSLAC